MAKAEWLREKAGQLHAQAGHYASKAYGSHGTSSSQFKGMSIAYDKIACEFWREAAKLEAEEVSE